MNIDLLYIIAAFILGLLIGLEHTRSVRRMYVHLFGSALMEYLQKEFNMTKEEALKAMHKFCDYL